MCEVYLNFSASNMYTYAIKTLMVRMGPASRRKPLQSIVFAHTPGGVWDTTGGVNSRIHSIVMRSSGDRWRCIHV